MTTNTNEKSFQKDLINTLKDGGYQKRTSKNYNTHTCLDIELVLKFIQSSQPQAWKKFERHHKESAPTEFIKSLTQNIKNKGTIEVLRNGFRDTTKFKLFYPKPHNNLNPKSKEDFNKNIFSVIDELKYEDKNNSNRLDLVIFINGIPISTIELKDTFSQGVENAMKQYKNDRNPNEPLFQQCLVHFAMSDEKIYMTTKLTGENTKFLPFNKGITNPHVKEGYKTSYLCTDILQPNQLSKLINNFIFKENDNIIFPRFHQLDCVNLLLKHPKLGENYLVQHSAGSGKTKTIAWLAHGLLNKFDENDKRIYDMIIIVSDRKVIDKQLQNQVKAIEKKTGVVEKIDKNSKQLAEAIKSQSNIIVTTIQKFSVIIDEIHNIENRKYAVIIDEAHSSQTGTHAKNLRKTLSSKDNIDEYAYEDAEDDIDELIITELEKTRNNNNISFFAFTATPKNKTLEMFGYKDETGEFRPHHLYSMKQAIEEGFILNVLENYLTYKTYFNLVKTCEDDPKFDEKSAKKLLKEFVEEHPHAISDKTTIILDHFMNSTIHKIKGKARAMVVTSSRKQAILYKLEFDRQIKSQNLPIKTLISFTGKKEVDTIEYTENNMNNIGNQSIKEAFTKDPYRILIVANKYQTGFDEPLLHTMYIDKKLNSVKAVQTLSRANRIAEDKNDTLILDFANEPEEIQHSFEPYYGETYLNKATDYHKLYEFMDNIYDFALFNEDDVEDFVKAYHNNANQSKLHNMLNKTVDNFKNLEVNEQKKFKKKLRGYQNIYSFLSQLLPFSDIDLEKLYIYNKYLNKKLPTINNPLPFNIIEDVDMSSYRIDKPDNPTKIILGDIDGELHPITGENSNTSQKDEKKLSEILEKINEAHGTDFNDSDKIFLKQLRKDICSNKELSNKIDINSRENVEAIFDGYFDEELRKLIDRNLTFYNKINDNEDFKADIKEWILDSCCKCHKKKN